MGAHFLQPLLVVLLVVELAVALEEILLLQRIVQLVQHLHAAQGKLRLLDFPQRALHPHQAVAVLEAQHLQRRQALVILGFHLGEHPAGHAGLAGDLLGAGHGCAQQGVGHALAQDVQIDAQRARGEERLVLADVDAACAQNGAAALVHGLEGIFSGQLVDLLALVSQDHVETSFQSRHSHSTEAVGRPVMS